MEISPDATIGSIASGMKRAIPYFEYLKIDYTCNGDLSLEEACLSVGIPVDEVMESLRQMRKQSRPTTNGPLDWDHQPLASVVEYILGHHHLYTRNQMGKITDLLEKTAPIYGLDYPQLVFLKDLFGTMREEIGRHMTKEEDDVFPYLLQREKAEADPQNPPYPFYTHVAATPTLRLLHREHHLMNEKWKEIHLLTDGYSPPLFAGSSFYLLYDALKELEQDIHQHLHIENNILYRRAVEKGWLE